MQNPSFLKKFLFVATVCLTVLFVAVGTSSLAQIINQTREQLGLPDSGVEQEENFSLPDSIYIVPLTMETEEFVSSTDWYKGLYYYQTFRLNQGDFLFHYLVTKEGDMFEGNEKGEEQRFAIKDTTEKPLVIGYFGDGTSTDFTPEARAAIGNLIIEVANRNRIGLDKVQVKSIEYQVTEDRKIVAAADIIPGRWERSVAEIVEEFSAKYDPSKFAFDLKVTKVKLPEEQVSFGQDVVAEITVKNNSSISLYQGSDFEPIMTLTEGTASKFFLNGVWSGLTQARIMSDGSSIRPGQERTYSVRLAVPLYFDKQTEKFELVNSLGQKYEGSQFDITLDVKRTDAEVVEIAANSVGYLNVRESANTSSTVITKVSPGQRFLVKEHSGGWLKIDTGANGEGWISQQFTKKV